MVIHLNLLLHRHLRLLLLVNLNQVMQQMLPNVEEDMEVHHSTLIRRHLRRRRRPLHQHLRLPIQYHQHRLLMYLRVIGLRVNFIPMKIHI